LMALHCMKPVCRRRGAADTERFGGSRRYKTLGTMTGPPVQN
jgi:hypothetical protein